MKNLQLLAPIAALICAAIVCGAVLLWAPVCSGTLELANGNMVPMRCTYTAKVELLLALILAAVAVAALVTKRPMTVALVLLSLAIVLLTFDTPLSIGVCKSADMACQSTALWLRIAGGISILGTTGIVEPMSEQALVDTIRVELRRHLHRGHPRRRPAQPRPQTRHGVGHLSRERMRG